ncbi:MAG: type IX secretion system membrane protein PorP/SprF, partial [Raineya sp.]
MSVIATPVFSQGLPNTPFHLHNFNNYSLLNPAVLGLPPLFGIPEDPLFFFTHHRQQIGAFQNTPVYSSLSFNKNFNADSPTPNSWGGNVYNFSRSIWQTTGGWLGYAREIPINAFGLPVNNLRLGLAMGAEGDGLRIDDDQVINDPAIANRRDKFARPIGQFGFMYIFGGKSGTSVWELGGGLPKLFKPSKLDNTVQGFYPIANWFLSISRQISTEKLQNWYAKPMIIYRTFDNKTNSIEVNTMFNYYNGKNHHWFGGSWLKDYGFAAIAGTKFYKSKFGISYAYKFNGVKQGFNNNPVHEIQLIYNLRRLNKLESRFQEFEEKVQDTTIYEDEVVMDSVLIVDTLTIAKQDTSSKEIMVSTDTLSNEQMRQQKELDYRNYVVVGSFIVKANADRMLRKLQNQYKLKGRV